MKYPLLALAGIAVVAAVVYGAAYLQPAKTANEISQSNTAHAQIKAVYNSLPESAKPLYYQQSNKLTKPVAERLVEIDKLTIGCFGPNTVMTMSLDDKNLGGQCCGVLEGAEAYRLQLKALEHFREENEGGELIPADPYDVSVEEAQKLIAFDEEITFKNDEQSIYDEAMELSHHGGPCCCPCWKWDMMSGVAKKLITEHDWKSEQVAKLWDLSSSCGHAEETNMSKHYTQPDSETSHH